jgi:hypothetical protein
MKIALPTAKGGLETYKLMGEPLAVRKPKAPFNRIAFAAAHVVVDPLAMPIHRKPDIDWKATLAYRRYLLDQGFGIAEAMDTSQRGMGLDWARALELISRSLKDAGPGKSALIYSGCGTDHLDPWEAQSLDDVVVAYLEQLHAIQKLGGRIILMASRALARLAKSPNDYIKVYSRVLADAEHPVILHWLGEMFDPELKGYWGASDFARAMKTCLEVIGANLPKIDASFPLDAKKSTCGGSFGPGRDVHGRRFNYRTDRRRARGYSHALLGIFDISHRRIKSLAALARGDKKFPPCSI